MRFAAIAAFAVLSLAACGERPAETPPPPPTEAAAPVPEEWRGKLTDAPHVARAYAPSEFTASAPATSVADASGVTVTTNSAIGAFSVVLDLGPEAQVAGEKALRLTVHVERGALQFIQTHRDFPAGYRPFSLDVNTSDAPTTLYLPVDTTGAPLLIIANASRDGASTGRITSAELVTAP